MYCKMKKMMLYRLLFPLMCIIAHTVNAQRYGGQNSSNFTLLKINGERYEEKIFPGAIVTLLTSGGQLNVTGSVPFAVYNCDQINGVLQMPNELLFVLRMHVNVDEFQNYLNTGKGFTTREQLTINGITRIVTVQYMPLPADPSLNGEISTNIRFKASDFNLKTTDKNSQFVIRITNARMNRI